MDQLGCRRYCCRRMIMTHVDLIEKLLRYALNLPSFEETMNTPHWYSICLDTILPRRIAPRLRLNLPVEFFFGSFMSFFLSSHDGNVQPSFLPDLPSTKFQWKVLSLFGRIFHIDTFSLSVIVIFQIINDTPLAAESIPKTERFIGLPIPTLIVSCSSTVFPLWNRKNLTTIRGFKAWVFCGGMKMFLHFH